MNRVVNPAVTAAFQDALAALKAGDFDRAQRLFKAVLTVQPEHIAALNLLGVVLTQLSQFAEAETYLRRAIDLQSRSEVTLYNYGLVLKALQRPAEALEAFSQALAINPAVPETWNNRGTVLNDLKRYEEAIRDFDRATQLDPRHAEAFYNRGKSLALLRRYDDALAVYESALILKPEFAQAWLGRGNVYFELKRYDDALIAYDRAAALNPAFAEAWHGHGKALNELKRYGEALAAFDKAAALRPDLAEAWLGRGNVVFEFKRYDDALAAYDKSLALKSDLADAWLGRGNVFLELMQYDKGLAAYERALGLKSDLAVASACLNMKLLMCDWTNFIFDREWLLSAIRERKPNIPVTIAEDTNRQADADRAVPPSIMARLTDDGAVLLASSIAWVREHAAYPRQFEHVRPPHGGKLRVGYVSQDFREHITGAGVVEMFETHDRSCVELFGFSLAPDDGSATRKRIEKSFDHFDDVSAFGDVAAARKIHELQIEVLIEIVPHSGGSRPAIMAHRPASIQVNAWSMGYSAGSSCIDYILGDPWMLPFSDQPFFLEKIVHLPHTCFPHDSTQVISQHTPARSDEGLPEQGFVFCCFNNSYKITPEFFTVWMNLLREVQGSVLWLNHNNDFAVANLRREAEQAGIDPKRLVFAAYRDRLADHLARHRLADLFLDTLPYNAQSTAMDALWAGLPVLTCAGRSYAGRFAMSQLHNIGLAELITDDVAAYERLALDLARDPQRLQAIRAKLERNRLTAPLFDTTRLCRELESAYQTMADIWRSGESPRSFSVEPAEHWPRSGR